MVSTRRTATGGNPSMEVPIVKKRKGNKSAKVKRPARVIEELNAAVADHIGLDEEEDQGEIPHTNRQSVTLPEQSRPVTQEYTRARSMHSVDSMVVINGLKEALKQRDKQLEEMRKLLVDHGVKGAEKLNFDMHAEDEGETSVHHNRANRRVIVGADRGDRSDIQWSSYKNFIDCKPPVFKGGEDPLDCMRWIREMEQVFESGTFSDHQQVVYAGRMLKEEAADWWNATSQAMRPEVRTTLTWDGFARRVRGRFCAASAVKKASRDFLDLEMGSMTVAKFNSLFLEKLQFAGKYCPDEASRVERYVEALRSEYRSSVRAKATLEEAMEEARMLELDEKDKNKVEVAKLGKKKMDESSSASKKKSSYEDSKRYDNHDDDSWCDSCKNRHSGPCSLKTMRCRRCGEIGHEWSKCENPPMCYNCKETGHISRDCPKEKVRAGRVCYNCREAGHLSRDCPKKKTD